MQGSSGFLKGLIVVNDVAYFGKSPPMERQGRDGPKVACDLVAVDLLRRKLLFVDKVATRGLLNIIAAPHMSAASTYVAQYIDEHVNSPLHHAQDARQQRSTDGHDVDVGATVQQASQQMLEGAGAAQWSGAWLKHAIQPSVTAGALVLLPAIQGLI